jgi:4-carboxymuconolactone decarboxylase
MMAKAEKRIAPLDPTDFSPEQAELVGAWTHLNFSKVIVRHPGMYRTFVPFIEQLIARSTLPPRDREVLVIRTLGLSGEVYEAHHHVQIAEKAGMSADEIAAAARGDAAGDAWDAALIAAAEELISDHQLSDANWAALAQRYSDEQRMEVVFLVGCYATMAMLTNSFGIAVEDSPETDERLKAIRNYT